MARVKEVGSGYYAITLTVSATSSQPLVGEVVFHLHPTFTVATKQVKVKDGFAVLNLRAWGAFTVGVEADDGRTTLELDLSEDESFPELFRSR